MTVGFSAYQKKSLRYLAMIRIALIVYLSLTAVFRPALCCCMAKQLAGSSCCSTKVALEPAASSHAHKSHKNCRGHGHDHGKSHSDGDSQVAEKEQQPKPCDHDDSNCRCGKSFASMAMMVKVSYQHSGTDVQDKLWLEHILSVLDLPATSVIQQTSFLAHIWDSDRYGIGILRAYQIMRC